MIARVDGVEVAAGNDKLMEYLGVPYIDCHSVGTIIHMAVDGKYAGHIVISDVVKPHSREAIQTSEGFRRRRRRSCSPEMRIRWPSRWQESLVSMRYTASCFPPTRWRRWRSCSKTRSEKEKLAFVGDGINDAPVLRRADIGIAMGAMGSDAAIEAADVVLMDDDPMKIAKAIRISRKCLRIVYQNIVFAIGIKLICLALGAVGIANMWLAIFADVGVMILAVLNAIRALFVKKL